MTQAGQTSRMHHLEMGAKAVTIMDVARRCGLSKATVSKALNLPADQCPLRHETQEKVRRAARELGYRPNWRARALANQKTQTIGMLYTPPILPLAGIYTEIFESFVQVMGDQGYHLLYVPVSGRNKDWSQILLSHRLDGCVAFESIPEPAEAVIANADLPTVLVNVESRLPVPRVMVDDREGALQATRHLLELGHRRVAFFHGPEAVGHYSVEARIAGYRDAMTQAGLAGQIEVANAELTTFVQRRLLGPDRPTAVLTYMHFFAIEMLAMLTRRGVRVPEQLSLATFNDIYPLAEMAPPITTVALPTQGMGRMAARLLLEQINEPDAYDAVEPQCVTLKEKLVVRESTARIEKEIDGHALSTS